MEEFNKFKYKDSKGHDVFILFDEASLYYMVAYNYTILDQKWSTATEAREYLLERGCVDWED